MGLPELGPTPAVVCPLIAFCEKIEGSLWKSWVYWLPTRQTEAKEAGLFPESLEGLAKVCSSGQGNKEPFLGV